MNICFKEGSDCSACFKRRFFFYRKNETDRPPSSFYMVRIMGRPPCIVLRIAFLGGTSGRLRKEVCSVFHRSIKLCV